MGHKKCKCGNKAEVKMYDYDGTVENVCWDCYVRDDVKSHETNVVKKRIKRKTKEGGM